MANEITLQSEERLHPVDENLRPLKVGGKATAIETAQYGNGAKITGDLEVTGNISGNVMDVTFDDVAFDDITCATITTTGTITAGGNIDAGINSLTANGGLIVDNITIDGSEIDSSGSLTIDAATNISLDINDVDDEVLFKMAGATFMSCYQNSGSYLRMYESHGGTDSFTIYCASNGATTIGTGDSAGQDANLTFDSDGYTTFQSFGYGGSLTTGKDITFKAGGDVIIDKNYSHTTGTTTKGLHVDVNRSGDVSSGSDVVKGIDLDVLTTGASGGLISSYGIDLDVVGDAGGTSFAYGIELAISGADTCYGIVLINKDGGTDFINRSSASGTDYFTLNTIEDGETTLTTVENGVGSTAHLNMVADGNFTVDAVGDISLDSATGYFIAKKAGTEFSVANSSYAGMILGYTTDGIDIASDSKTLSTSMTTTDANHNVSFIAPPSGVVEIFISIYCDFSRRTVVLGLSDNATYAAIDFPNSADTTNEHLVAFPPSASGDRIINHRWVVTGLTAGDTYKWWLGARSSHNLANTLRWGGVSVSGEYSPFIMKATALPTAVTDFAVYG